ncbi:hypothetical protein [Flavobacterium salmonis]|uniref:Uncharacterized protein n=1 Tax=Flavobacterium salmonis TaxID=2654844 RepID=A0A6V6YSA9_9FLAO|nr:hypothetical protein [Flavobacterium salmonis]CAD0002375.1 hypothetical protein FLAT13_01091 [Flavobacterium salmonis]
MKTNQVKQKSIENRSNQLNPNNREYRNSREKNNAKVNVKKNEHCDWDQDAFGDDWEFNHN